MHKVYQRSRQVSNQEYQQRLGFYNCGNNIAAHMRYIYALMLYDKMGMTFRKLDNLFTKVYELQTKLKDDDNDTVTAESLLVYTEKKGLKLYDYVIHLPRSEKLYLGDMKKGVRVAAGAVDSGLLKTLILIVPVLKETYRFSNAKIEEFLEWVAYGIKMYNTKLPQEKGMVFSDEYIRQIFIEDEGWDIKKGEPVRE